MSAAKRKPTTPRKRKEEVIEAEAIEIIDLTDDVVEVLDSDDPRTGTRVLVDANGDTQVIPDVSQDLPGQMDVKKRRMVALTLRLSGANYAAIASATKVSQVQAKRDVAEAFKELDRDDVRMQRAIYHQRLETLLMTNWSQALSGDQTATNNVLSVMDRIDKLFNLSGGDFDEGPKDEHEGHWIIAENTSSADYLAILNNARKALTKGEHHDHKR